ncbi:MAG: hypothetical protein ACREE2_00765 [Stellaceae bacterium]
MSTAFYPCCAHDIEEPRALLRNYVDHIIFCDINERHSFVRNRPAGSASARSPTAELIFGDAREVVHRLPEITVLFYRRDSTGEGGSGVFVLGDSFLPLVLQRFSTHGGLIVTDGSNSRGGNFKKMIRTNGLMKHGWKFSKSSEQPFLERHQLHIIEVKPLSDGR